MAHHKRGRPKNRRAGCLMCKPWKANGVKKRGDVSSPPMMDLGRTWKQEWRAWLDEQEQLEELDSCGEPH